MAEATHSDERLTQINSELSSILEAKVEFLTRVLGETQRFTQKIANTELEIQRNSAQHRRLKEQCDSLDDDVKGLTERVVTATSERDERQQEKYAKEKEIQRLDWEISDKRKNEVDSTERIKVLDSELDGLEKESNKLETRITVLREGVDRMKRVREEYLKQIAGLDQEMKSLAASEE
jgi:chromosome segregation ATPase